MKQTIEKIWNQSLSPAVDCGAGNEELEHLEWLMEQNGDALCKELNEQQKEIFQKYIACAEEYTCLLTAQAFCDGFCLAGKLFAEALT